MLDYITELAIIMGNESDEELLQRIEDGKLVLKKYPTISVSDMYGWFTEYTDESFHNRIKILIRENNINKLEK